MAATKAIRGVLGNFLGTYTSRYSQLDGYWLFGFLVGDLSELRIDLLVSDGVDPDYVRDSAAQLARVKFSDQLNKARVSADRVREAWLTIRKLPGEVTGPVNGHPTAGHHVSFNVCAVLLNGRCHQRECTEFIAPHNPLVESRSSAC